MGWACSAYGGEERSNTGFLVGKPEGKRPLGRARCRWEDNIMVDLKLARQASATPLLGPEPALGIPNCLVREAIKNWTETQHLRAWIDLPGLKTIYR
jgi:hypothetical protein